MDQSAHVMRARTYSSSTARAVPTSVTRAPSFTPLGGVPTAEVWEMPTGGQPR